MQLARHSDPKLTMAVYGRAQLHDLGAAVGRLPGLLCDGPKRQALQATGTDGGNARCTSVAPKSDGERDGVRLAEAQDARREENETGHNSLKDKAVEADRDSLRLSESSSPTRTRTWNKPVNRRARHPAENCPKGIPLQQLTAFYHERKLIASTCENTRKIAGVLRILRSPSVVD
jgi:hypothetical protein